MRDEKKLRSLLGFAKKAGKVINGTDMAVESVRSGKKNAVKLFILASDASANTEKRIRNTSEYYSVPMIVTQMAKSELAHTVGSVSEISVIGVTDTGFADAMLKTTYEDQNA